MSERLEPETGQELKMSGGGTSRSKRANKKEQDVLTFHQSVNELSSFGRIVNAVELEQKLKTGSVDLKTVIRELLNLKTSFKPDELNEDKFFGLSNQLAEFAAVAEKKCGDKGEDCANLDIISKGIDPTESVGELNIGDDIFKEGSPLSILRSGRSLEAISKDVKSLSIDIEKMLTGDFDGIDDKHVVIGTVYNKTELVFNFPIYLEKLKTIDLEKLKKDIDSLLIVDRVKSSFSDKNVDYTLWMKTLENLQKILNLFGSSLPKDVLSEIETKMKLLLDTIDNLHFSMDDKPETLAFFNGAKDLSKLHVDMKSDIIIKILGLTEDFLKDLFPNVLQLENKFKTILKIEQDVNLLNVLNALIEVKSTINSTKPELDALNKIKPLFDCFLKTLKANSRETVNLKALKEHIEKDETALKKFLEKLNVPSLTVLPELLRALKEGETDKQKAVKNFSKIDEAKTELTKFGSFLENVDPTYIETFSVKSNIEKVISFSETNKKACSFDKATLADIKATFGNLTSLSNVPFKTINDEISSISSYLQFLETFKSEWIKLESATKPKREAGINGEMKNGTSYKLNSGTNVLIGLDRASQQEFVKFVNELPNIQNAISKSTNSYAKDNLEKELIPAFNTFTEVSKVAIDAHYKKKYIKTDSGIGGTFQLKIEDKSLIDVNMDLVMKNLRLIKASYPDDNAAMVLKNIPMRFSKAGVALKEGQSGYRDALDFFNPLSGRLVETSKKKDEEKIYKWNWWYAVYGGLCLILLAMFPVALWIDSCLSKPHLYRLYAYLPFKKMKEKGRYHVLINKIAKEKRPSVVIVTTVNDKPVAVEVLTKQQNEEAPQTDIPFEMLKDDYEPPKQNNGKKEEKEEEEEKEEIKHIIMTADEYKKIASEKDKKKVKKQTLCQQLINMKAAECPNKPVEFEMKAIPIEILRNLHNKRFENVEPSKTPIEFTDCAIEYLVGRKHERYPDNVGQADVRLPEEGVNLRTAETHDDITKEDINLISGKILRSIERSNMLSIEQTQDSDADNRHQAGGEKKEVEKKAAEKKKKKPFLPLTQKTNTQLLGSFDVTLSETPPGLIHGCNNDHSSLFFSAPIRTNEGLLDYPVLLHGMISPNMLKIESWPYTDRTTGVVCPFPLPLSVLVEVFNDAKSTASRIPALLEKDPKEAVFVGDIHGKLRDFFYALSLFLEDDEKVYFFLGDYVDRGARSIDVALCVALTMLVNPEKAYFLAGNHEMPSVNLEYGFLDECIKVFGDIGGPILWNVVNQFFALLPQVAIVKKKAYCAHGGPCRAMEKGYKYFKTVCTKQPVNEEQASNMFTVKWTDFSWFCSKTGWCTSGSRGYSQLEIFNAVLVNKVLSKMKLEVIFRAHQVMADGYSYFAVKKLVSLFGSTNNEDNNKSALAVMDKDNKISFIRFQNSDPQLERVETAKQIYKKELREKMREKMRREAKERAAAGGEGDNAEANADVNEEVNEGGNAENNAEVNEEVNAVLNMIVEVIDEENPNIA